MGLAGLFIDNREVFEAVRTLYSIVPHDPAGDPPVKPGDDT